MQTWENYLTFNTCYRLNVYVFLKLICLNLISMMVFGCGVSGKWLGHETEALINEISRLNKETPEISFTPSTMWGQSEMAIYQPRGGHLPDNKSASALVLRNLALNLHFQPPALWEISIYCLSHWFYAKQPKIMLQDSHLHNGFNDNSCLKELSWQLKYLNHLNIYHSTW